MKIIITGGAGFIGSAVARHIINEQQDEILIVDKLTYAGNLESLAPVSHSPRYHFTQADICDREKMTSLFAAFQPDEVQFPSGVTPESLKALEFFHAGNNLVMYGSTGTGKTMTYN